MVSIRRRRLLGLCSGRSSFLYPLLRFCENGNASGHPIPSTKNVSVHPMPSVDAEKPKEKTIPKASPGSSNLSGSSTSKDQHTHQYPVPEVKRRKRHRRKHFENQEPCVMRGVYLKNMKWQAAIKVDKKQIHLGTVGSQEEAARLYDRYQRRFLPSFRQPLLENVYGLKLKLYLEFSNLLGLWPSLISVAGLLLCVGGNPISNSRRKRSKNFGSSSGMNS
ncbi:ethylene-responsive transcription factor-like protein At4g13040 isoform X2 [Rhododendron vialii]|uniref:ethylene-responsive transcription factor-like protein At4g13040 isoform X2 n=1 Tax=Rhododendron vialii TaxID=182163 RepID=UPI00265F452B|nr:ethylene-responsive transcription factor-like protein At4g13040 isoform X2 [Rhododendron vialii]